MEFRSITILEKTNNKKGDLFCRLMSDLFHALGYDQPRFDVHKSGREIDLTTRHRTEKKIAIAECKAHKSKIGGDDINKFIGALDAEKRKYKKSDIYKSFNVTGYFVSLSGYKETSIEQEQDLDDDRVILITPSKIVKELIHGKIIVSLEKAISKIDIGDKVIEDFADLIAYQKGWVWAIYLGNGQQTSHICFIHAEGQLLVNDLAKEIVTLDSKLDKRFEGLEIVSAKNLTNQIKSTKSKYFKYLENECGEIHFEGLPTDKDSGSVKVKLENIFIVPHLEKIPEHKEQKKLEDLVVDNREGIGEVLKKNGRIAILAKPGGGKSTLIKRLAIAYAYPNRKSLIKDDLPNKSWFPVFIRCRELGERVKSSITEIIEGIPNRAEIGDCSEEFRILVSNSLQNGNALLLIDGLDEISEDRNRISFINQLRTFTATYPQIQMVITSREAGFRIVGGVIASYCTNYRLSGLNDSEIEALSLKWHKEIIDDTQKTQNDALNLSRLIISDSRIRTLAENPLLLTTLLFVRRWAGYLPTKKSVLYQEMIKLLLVTWNVEGHEQLDIEEAEPQLAYVAFWMTCKGVQTIAYNELKSCLLEARKQMPDILGFTNVSVPDFINRVESRSSLLILSGHKKLNNEEITPIYEFLHLSFQEHLTAKAIVEKFVPDVYSGKTSLEILEPYILDETWKEVIPLVAILLKRDSSPLIEYLVEQSVIADEMDIRGAKSRHPEKVSPAELLGNCIANEIQVAPTLLEKAIEWFAKNRYNIHDKSSLETILNSKFESAFRNRLKYLYFEEYDDKFSAPIGGLIGEAYLHKLRKEKSSVLDQIISDILSSERETCCIGLFALMIYSYELQSPVETKEKELNESNLDDVLNKICDLIESGDPQYSYPACWSVAWISESFEYSLDQKSRLINIISESWLNCSDHNLSRVHSWSIITLMDSALKIEKFITDQQTMRDALQYRFNNPINDRDKLLCILLGYHLKVSFDKSEVQQTLNLEHQRRGNRRPNIKEYARLLKIELNSSKSSTQQTI